jgi:signal transduction histidine kinase
VLVAAGGYVAARGLGRELAAARLRTDFVDAVSHEFRTPVASVRQLSELLEEGRVSDPARRAEYYRLLRRESVRLQRLVENLLDFRRLEAGAVEYRCEPLDAGRLVLEIVGEFRDQHRSAHRIAAEVPALLPLVRGDGDALGLALWNLLDNAAKYSPAGSAITVDAAAAAGAVEIRIRDEGPGIPADDQARIFEKFVRGSTVNASGPKGAGIGLAMVKQIVEAHRGRVGLESRPGAGSTFIIQLPAEAIPS